MQFYIYCAVPGPKCSQLNKFHMYFSSVKSPTLYSSEISFHPEDRIEEAIYIASSSLRFHYLYVKSCVRLLKICERIKSEFKLTFFPFFPWGE